MSVASSSTTAHEALTSDIECSLACLRIINSARLDGREHPAVWRSYRHRREVLLSLHVCAIRARHGIGSHRGTNDAEANRPTRRAQPTVSARIDSRSPTSDLVMIEIAVLLALAAGGTGVLWYGSARLEEAANDLAAAYGLPAVVQGAVIAAVGSSMPELVSVLLATLLHGEFELGVGSIVGSAVFNLLAIPGLAVVVGGGIDTSRELVYKESLFYMLAVASLLLTFSLAVIYNPVAGGDGLIRGDVSRPLALFPVALYGLYIFTQYLDAADEGATTDTSVDVLPTWLQFGVGLVAIVLGVEALVRSAVGLGDAFGTPTFLWGMTVVAAGSSLPDTFVSLAAARADRPTVTLANVLGSNTFDLLVAVPVGVLVAGSLTVNFAHIVPMMSFLVLATIVFFSISRTEMRLSIREAWLLLGLYGAFLCWLLLESLRVVSVLEL